MMTGYTALLKNMIALWLGFLTTMLAACPFPHDPNTPAPLFADTKSTLCPTDTSENGGPQGRLVRGGCLEHFTYVFAEDHGRRISPPEALPDRVTGFHRRSGVDVELRIETHSTDRCIKDQAGQQIDDSATRLYDVYAWT